MKAGRSAHSCFHLTYLVYNINHFVIMEEKKLNERESLELITRMIQETKNKLEVGDGNVLLIWGYVSVLTAILVYVLLLLAQTPQVNWLWFLIPLIGYPVMKSHRLSGHETGREERNRCKAPLVQLHRQGFRRYLEKRRHCSLRICSYLHGFYVLRIQLLGTDVCIRLHHYRIRKHSARDYHP